MNTLSIKAFLAIVRHGSLTEAANSLFISQSTLSHRLAELEREIGLILIERGRGIKFLTLTDSGKEFLVIAKRWEDLVEDTKKIQFQAKKINLTIGAVDTFHAYFFPALYQALREHNPAINLNIKTYNSTELYLEIDRGEIDVAFPLLELPMSNIDIRRFYTEPRVVLRKETSSGTCNAVIEMEDLDFTKEVFFVGDPRFHEWYDQWKGRKGLPLLQVDTAQLLLPLLNKVGTWSIVPLCIARKVVSQGSYVYYRLDDPPPERVCYKIQSKHLKPSAIEGIKILDSYLEMIFSSTQ